MSYKSSTGRNIGKLLNLFQSDKTILGQGIGGGGSAAAVFSATGGTLVQSGGYNYHVFTQPDIFSVTNTTGVGVTMTSLLVGGGGGMGGGGGGSGGAGGVVQFIYCIGNSSSIPVTVGSGGGTGSNGNPSVLNATSVIGYAATALGGGRGGQSNIRPDGPSQVGSSGGSGGGGGSSSFPPSGGVGGSAQTVTLPMIRTGVGVGTYIQGNPGGDSGSGGGSGSAGGEGGTPGSSAPFSNFPGPVISPAIPAPVRPSWTSFVGPTGLFGQGGPTPGAIDYTGTGGGGGTGYGGSGIVIIRYLTP